MQKRSVKQTALWPPRGQAEVMRAELAQSWRDSDVELGLKQARRSPVSAAAAKALEATFSISDLIGPCPFSGSILWTPCSFCSGAEGDEADAAMPDAEPSKGDKLRLWASVDTKNVSF